MKEANDIFETILTITFILAGIIIVIGIFPYVVRMLKASHAAADSLSDLYHHSIKPKHITSMNKQKDFKPGSEFYIDPEGVKLDDGELNVSLPQSALSTQIKVMALNERFANTMTDLNRKRPITEWGRQRFINKIRDNNIAIELLIDQMGLHDTMISQAAVLEAKMMYAPQLVKDELDKLVIKGKYEKEKLVEQYIDEIDEIRTRRRERDLTIKIREAEHDRYVMETTLGELEMRAKINTILATNRQEKARAELMEKAITLFEEGKLSDKLMQYLIICTYNFGSQQFVDLGMDEEMQDILKKDKKYDANKKKWEAKSSKEDYKHKKETLKRQQDQRRKRDEG